LGKLLKLRIPVLIGYDDDVMGRSKRVRKWGVSHLTFLPNSWWEYLDWAKEARKVVDQVIGGRPNPGMRALLNFIDQFIRESFGRREYSLSPEARYRFLVLEHLQLWDEDIDGSASWRAQT
jgi:hypothetical protein